MSFPIFPDKHDLPAMLTADKMIEFRRRQGSWGSIEAPETVILCLYKGVMRYFPLKYSSRRVTGFLGDMYLLKGSNGKIGVMGNFGIGSPVVASIAEEMAAWGTKRIVILSLAGGLQPDLSPGDVVIGNQAIRDEGTSYHYLPAGKYVDASSKLISELSSVFEKNNILCSIGGTWSTDAPYRESHEEAACFQGEGILTVDMESAGLYAVGQVRNVETASIFVIGDSLAGPSWSAPPDMGKLHRKLKECLRVLTLL
jgi:uridine phosphorylase